MPCSIHWNVQVPKNTHNCPQVLCVTVLSTVSLASPNNYAKIKIIARNYPTRARRAQTNPSWISKNIPSTATPCAPGSRHPERKNSISVNTIKHIFNLLFCLGMGAMEQSLYSQTLPPPVGSEKLERHLRFLGLPVPQISCLTSPSQFKDQYQAQHPESEHLKQHLGHQHP